MQADKVTFEALQNFDPKELSQEELQETKPVTFWIPIDKKVKYDKIQDLSHQKYGKLLKQAVIESIDSVKIED